MGKWCEHLEYIGSCAIYKEEKIERPIPTKIMGMEVNFCPICGTPRPKEKTLAEKFDYYLKDKSYEARLTIANELAEIAEKHYGFSLIRVGN